MEIRAARKEEWPVCADIYVRSGRGMGLWEETDACRADLLLEWAEQGEELYLAFDAGRPVAVMSYWRPDNFIHNLFVAPDAQRRGFGTALLNFAYGLAEGSVTLKCDPRNLAALRFYQRRGMVEIERGLGPHDYPYVLFRQP